MVLCGSIMGRHLIPFTNKNNVFVIYSQKYNKDSKGDAKQA